MIRRTASARSPLVVSDNVASQGALQATAYSHHLHAHLPAATTLSINSADRSQQRGLDEAQTSEIAMPRQSRVVQTSWCPTPSQHVGDITHFSFESQRETSEARNVSESVSEVTQRNQAFYLNARELRASSPFEAEASEAAQVAATPLTAAHPATTRSWHAAASPAGTSQHRTSPAADREMVITPAPSSPKKGKCSENTEEPLRNASQRSPSPSPEPCASRGSFSLPPAPPENDTLCCSDVTANVEEAAADGWSPAWSTGVAPPALSTSHISPPSWVVPCDVVVRATAAQQSALDTAPTSSCLPAGEPWAEASLLRSPLADSLRPPMWEGQVCAVGITPVPSRSFSCFTATSPEPEAVPAPVKRPVSSTGVQDAGLDGSGSWDAKRVRHTSATRRSRASGPVLSRSVSAMSFSAPPPSPLSEVRSGSIAAQDTSWGHKRRSNSGKNREDRSGQGSVAMSSPARVPYWTSLPPAIHGATSVALSPVLPRTLSAPSVLPNTFLQRPAQAVTATGGGSAGASVQSCVLRRYSPAPPVSTEAQQRWCMPPSMRCEETGKATRASRRPACVTHYRGRRYAVQLQDVADKVNTPPTY